MLVSVKKEKQHSDVFDTFATHASLVYDITDLDYWAQNGSTHGPSFMTFKCQFLTNKAGQCFSSSITGLRSSHHYVPVVTDELSGRETQV